MKITRRKLAGALAGTVAAVRAQGQMQRSSPADPDEELRAARDRIKTNSETLARQSIPMSTEPAFQFKA